ncbi:MAG TPA: acyltransferase family protein [Armatimonadota bacterium]|jgi:peptidoglycan/LPS O-acetylase OafA/YrhL
MAEDGRRESARISGLDAVRGMAILAVVAIHTLGHFLPRLTGAEWFAAAALNRGLQFAVPAFLTLSAFLTMRPLLAGEPAGTWYRRRLHRALTPYLLWSAVYIVLRFRHGLNTLSVADAARMLLRGNAWFHLYFMVLLVQLIACLPAVAALFRRRPPFWAVALGAAAAQAGAYILNARVLHLAAPGSAILWYIPAVALGSWMAARGDGLEAALRRGRWPAGVAALAALAFYLPLGLALLKGRPLNTAAYQAALWLYTPAATFLLIAGGRRLRWKPLNVLGAHSLEIYLLHPLAILALDRLAPGLPVSLGLSVCLSACILLPLAASALVGQAGAGAWAWGGASGQPPGPTRRAAALAGIAVTVAAGMAWDARRAAPDPTPRGATLFTSTRRVAGLAMAPDGALWAATSGGVLRRDPAGKWTKFTRLNGLPSQDARGITLRGGLPVVKVPSGVAVFQGGAWTLEPGHATAERPRFRTSATIWRGRPWISTLTGLRGKGLWRWRDVGMPPVKSGHITALLARPDALWAAVSGDGIWAFNGARWKPVDIGVPQSARDITGLAADAHTLWAGTRENGLWSYQDGVWSRVSSANEPDDHDIQSVADYHGDIVAAARGGVNIRRGGRWSHAGAPDLSTDAPRQAITFRGALYLRHGNGRVDRWDGVAWKRHLWPYLPHADALCLATDGRTLYIGQRGGWSEWDGTRWTHHFGDPALAGRAIRAIFPRDGEAWMAVAGSGVARYSPTGGTRLYPEPGGDVATLGCGHSLYAGTAAGKLWKWDGAAWRPVRAAGLGPIRAIAPDKGKGTLVACGAGLFVIGPDGRPRRDPCFAIGDVRALQPTPRGLWIGSRAGLAWLPNEPAVQPSRLRTSSQSLYSKKLPGTLASISWNMR